MRILSPNYLQEGKIMMMTCMILDQQSIYSLEETL